MFVEGRLVNFTHISQVIVFVDNEALSLAVNKALLADANPTALLLAAKGKLAVTSVPFVLVRGLSPDDC